MSAPASPARLRSNLPHPSVDGDGHWIEYAPVLCQAEILSGITALPKGRRRDGLEVRCW